MPTNDETSDSLSEHIPYSFIKNIAIQLPENFKFENSPIPDDGEHLNKERLKFIGREEIKKKFKDFLGSDAKKGVFLVTGYRGMGKTSFVNMVLAEYKKEKREEEKKEWDKTKWFKKIINPWKKQVLAANIIPVHLTIAQTNPTEIDILRQLVSSIFDKYKEQDSFKKRVNGSKRIKYWLRNLKYCLGIMLALALIPLMLILSIHSTKETPSLAIQTFAPYEAIATIIVSYLFVVSVILLIALLITKRILDHKKQSEDNKDFYKEIKDLAARTFSSVSEEQSNSKQYNLELKGFKAVLEDSEPKIDKSYPMATAKEIEYGLTSLLNLTKKRNINLEFIFIFDELDKIDVGGNDRNIYENLDRFELLNKDANLQNLLRNRKQAVMNIIAGLKNFFTSANARFIFIAGREMFDASLADVSDRQSPLSSIFTYTFNIESLLKDDGNAKTKNKSSLTPAIEGFLKNQLADRNELEKISDKGLFEFLKEKYEAQLSPEAYAKIWFSLQAFVTYLTYRSNGSPKKLIKTFHEFVVNNNSPQDKTYISETITARQETESGSTFFLYFSYYNQYRIGYINHLYRPFLIQFGRSFKLFSDNAIFSIPFLIDHLIKFHPFAFSRTNLELVPEVLSTNKTPSVKQDLDEIIAYLGNTHLRDTDIELFEYKFYSKSYNEIRFLSRIFEDEAAAFNFTLDESYSVKLLLNDKIKELRSIFSKFYKDSDGLSQQIFSIAYHNGNLGDLHFFDQEYDDAIGNFSDAIRPINNLQVHNMNLRDFITLIRNKLKIGLCFEKISSYEEALTFYSDSTQDAKRFISYHLKKANPFEFIDVKQEQALTIEPEVFFSSSLNDLLQIIVQCFISDIYIQEKMGLEGITTIKVQVALGAFLALTDSVSSICGRNNLIIANSFLHLGKLLYFKNSSFPTGELGTENSSYPEWMAARLSLVRKTIKPAEDNEKEAGKRQPLLAYSMYLLALDEVLSARGNIFKKFSAKGGISLLDHFYTVYKEDGKGPYLNDQGIPVKNLLPDYFEALNRYLENKNESLTANYYKYIANLLTSIGDCILGFYGLHIHVSQSMTMVIDNKNYGNLDAINIFSSDKLIEKTADFQDALYTSADTFFSVADVFRCYYLSSLYFLKSGRSFSAGFQYRKILHALKLLVSNKAKNPMNKTLIDFLERTIVKKALDIASAGSGRADIHMLEKAVHYSLQKSDRKLLSNQIANHPATREIGLLFEYIKLKLDCPPKDIRRIINSNFSVATQYVRIMELDYYSKYVYKVNFADILDNHKKLYNKQNEKKLYNKQNEIIDYLYSMNSLLRILKIYGTDYMLSASFVGYIHFRIANFLIKIKILGQKTQQLLTTRLRELMGDNSRVSTDPLYHFCMAKDHYEDAIQLHTAGSVYKKTVKDMIYLEDDFNDDDYHFGAALDRYILVKEGFKEKIKTCDDEIQKIKSSNNAVC